MNFRRLAVSFLLGLWIYCLILWAWVGLNYYLEPSLQFAPLSIYVPIRQNLAADLAFPISFISFVLWSYLRKME